MAPFSTTWTPKCSAIHWIMNFYDFAFWFFFNILKKKVSILKKYWKNIIFSIFFQIPNFEKKLDILKKYADFWKNIEKIADFLKKYWKKNRAPKSQLFFSIFWKKVEVFWKNIEKIIENKNESLATNYELKDSKIGVSGFLKTEPYILGKSHRDIFSAPGCEG